MEWVETTAKTVEEAQERALDQLGVAADEAEFEVIEEPRSGLFGRLRGEARVRARVKPASVRPKHDRRQRGRRGSERSRGAKDGGQQGDERGGGRRGSGRQGGGRPADQQQRGDRPADQQKRGDRDGRGGSGSDRDSAADAGEQRSRNRSRDRGRGDRSQQEHAPAATEQEEQAMSDDRNETVVTPEEVGEAARQFMVGLATAMGADATTDVEVDGTEIDVRVSGHELGLLVGPGGRTLTAVQDLARVASQRRLGDHDTRLRIDVGGYREKRRAALEKFAVAVAHQVLETGATKALEPMSSADRKIVHDAIADVDGVTSRSDGDEPARRVVISPS